MSSLAIVLLVISAVIHASWNAASKHRTPSAAFFLVSGVSSCILLLPLLWLQRETLAAAPPRLWQLLPLTAVCQCLYFWGLGSAYRCGDLSVVYPLARGLPVIGVTAISVLLGRGEALGPVVVIGMLVAVAGCIVLPLASLRELHWRRYCNRACVYGVVAAIGTAGYSLLDDLALRAWRETASGNTAMIAMLYLTLELTLTSLWLVPVVCIPRDERRRLVEVWQQTRWLAAGAGVATFVAYALVLVAMAHVRDISFVVAFRQLSIPVGALLGIVLLKEPAHAPKLAGIALIVSGLVAVALG
jgi:drug/metabolite transporter (DMT)-like permease